MRTSIHAILFAIVFTFTYPWILVNARFFVQEGIVSVKDAVADVDDSLKHLTSPKPHQIAKPREEKSFYVAKAHDIVVSPNQQSM